MPLPPRLTDVTQANLDQLISENTREGPHLDFKRDMPVAWNNEAKHEFLADVTAFANSGGGDLVFGVDEDGQAQASAVVPQAVANPDQEVRRMQDFLLNLAEPRLPGVQVQAVPVTVGAASGHAIVVRVPQSWAGLIGSKPTSTSSYVMGYGSDNSMFQKFARSSCVPRAKLNVFVTFGPSVWARCCPAKPHTALLMGHCW